MLVWVDTETSGLHAPADGLLLEVAVVVTDGNLNELDAASEVIGHSEAAVDARFDRWARQQHSGSGLLDEVCAPGWTARTVRAAERRLLDWLRGHTPREASPMCGSTVCYDRQWLSHHMPALEAWFHYRSVDVSTVIELASRWAPDAEPAELADKPHRALGDIRRSISLLRAYRDCGFVGLPLDEEEPK